MNWFGKGAIKAVRMAVVINRMGGIGGSSDLNAAIIKRSELAFKT